MARRRKCPADRIKQELKSVLEAMNCWRDDLSAEIPKSWEKYGNLVLFNGEKYFRDPSWGQVDDVWRCICRILNVECIALKSRIQQNCFRSPSVTLVWGKSTVVHCKDNGILYSWDIMESMFSAGNAAERHRISKMNCHGETVVDMYAGIGYFTLPYLVHAKAKSVHACEWNEHAIEALKKNLAVNNVAHQCTIHEGDSRLVTPKYIADRVNLGLLPTSQAGWEAACYALKPQCGGILHIHENVTSGLGSHSSSASLLQTSDCLLCSKPMHKNANIFNITWKKLEWKIWALHVCHSLYELFEKHYANVWSISVLDIHNVKSYAPHIDHVVLDIHCKPQVC